LAETKGHIRKALDSAGWLVVERVTILLLNFFVGILVARYLAPEAFGALSYATALVGLLAALPYLGLAGTVVQQLVLERDRQAEIMGTVMWAKAAAGLVALLLANIVAMFVAQDDRTRLLIFLVSWSLFFDASSGIRLVFESRTDVRHLALATSFAGIATALARVAAVALQAPLWVFAVMVAVQSALTAFGYLALYRRFIDRRLHFPFNRDRAKLLFAKSWPLIVSTAAASIYLRIDQVMLGEMLGMASVGTYAVAARLSEVWYMLPAAVATAIFPRLVELKASDPAKYERRIKESLRYQFWLSLLIAVPVTIVAPLLIVTLYGDAYREAGLILAIHVWACPAVFMGMVIEKWFVTEDLLKYLIGRQLMAAGVNVALNYLLIPRYAGAGAAVATVIAYTLAYYLSCFTSRRTVQAGRWMTEAVLWPVLRH
jgi:PST family polysaccharide transporter